MCPHTTDTLSICAAESTGEKISLSMAVHGPISPKPGVSAEGASSVHLASDGTEPIDVGDPLTDNNSHSGCGSDTTITDGAPA